MVVYQFFVLLVETISYVLEPLSYGLLESPLLLGSQLAQSPHLVHHLLGELRKALLVPIIERGEVELTGRQ
jgi:hypothetical protein